jgi:hypothetical protein
MKGLDFEAVEVALRQRVFEVAARMVERKFNEDHSDERGPVVCTCGKTMRFCGRRRKQIETVFGLMELERAYFHCARCERGVCPRDRVLGVEGTFLSPAVTRMVGVVGAMVSFKEGSDLLRDLAGLEVEAKQVERTTEALGREIAWDERHYIEPAVAVEIPPTLYLGVDGTGIPMRKEELAGRSGKQADGSAKTREVKLCTIWSAESRDKEGRPTRDDGSISYSAAIEGAASLDTDTAPSEFAERAMREATRRGFDRAKRRAFLGDGAKWIWNLADEHFPDAIQIVDFYHAKERLSTVAKAIYGETSKLAKRWAEKRHDELERGDLEAVIQALKRHGKTSKEARKCVAYLRRNKSRMRYDEFWAQGLCTSTAVTESGCKTAIGARLKRGGMHWTVSGANAIIALRCAKLSRRFENFWERRTKGNAAR